MPDALDPVDALTRRAGLHPAHVLRTIAAWDSWRAPVVREGGLPRQQIVFDGDARHAVAFSSPEAAARWRGPALSDELTTLDGRTLIASLGDDLTSLTLDGGSAYALTLTAEAFPALRRAATAARAIRLLAAPARTPDELRRIWVHPTWYVLRRADGETLDTVSEDGVERLVVCSGADAAQAWLAAVPGAHPLTVGSDLLFREVQKLGDVAGLIFDPRGPGPTVRHPMTLAAELVAAGAG
jgi:hypothetical protein